MRSLAFLSAALAFSQAAAFVPTSRLAPLRSHQSTPRLRPTKLTPLSTIPELGQSLVAYSDELNVTTNGAIAGISFIGVTAVLSALFFLLTKNVKAKKFEFDLSEQEAAAVKAVDDLFDPTDTDKALTEAGTQGFVKRRQLADRAKEQYQEGKDLREVRDKTLYYAEVDLSFLAALLRVAQPKGGVFYDLGSGTGKTVFGAASLYRWKKAVGVELLPLLHKEAQSYQAKYKRLGGSPTEFVNKDFTDPKVSVADADVIFAYATRYLSTSDGYTVDVTEKVLDAPVGARIITLDRRLKGSQFKLLKKLDDLAGDLQRVSGYVYEKVE